MKFVNSDETLIATGDGRFIPTDPANSDYAAIIAAGVSIGSFVPPAPTADDVRAEASRRMQTLVGARNAGHLAVILSNASREAIRLQNLRLSYLSGEPNSRDWTEAEIARAAELKIVDAMLEDIRAASNVLEVSLPDDFANDSYWTPGA